MTNKEAIKYLRQLYPNGGHCWLDTQRMEAINMAISALKADTNWAAKIEEAYHCGHSVGGADKQGKISQAYTRGAAEMQEYLSQQAVEATCLLLPPPDSFKVLLCHPLTNRLSKGETIKIITVQ